MPIVLSHRVERNQVDVAEHALAELDERIDMLIIVVDAIDGGVFESWTASRKFAISPDLIVQKVERHRAHPGHELVACLLYGGVKRYGERELLRFLGEPLNALEDTAGGNGDVPCSNAEEGRIVHETKGIDNRVVVVEGLALPHGNDIAHPLREILLHEFDLIEHLAY